MTNGKLFVVTLWVLRALIIVTMVAIVVIALGMAIVIYGLIASSSLARAIGAAMTLKMAWDEYGRVFLPTSAGNIVTLTLAQLICRALRRVVASASVGDPFIEANAADLVRIAWLLLGWDVFDWVIKPTVYAFLSLGPKVSIPGLLDGFLTPRLLPVLLVFVLAQIFRRGSDMRAELAETI